MHFFNLYRVGLYWIRRKKMTVQELIDELQDCNHLNATIYMRIGGLPLVNVDKIEIDKSGYVILYEDNEY
ncbi:hypothetical protein A0256_23280 [Mucilaginibacter sp. PAMC 26640]|nr:hypothetical protein A0256_23280 [Mucilaginibacter sp. PAMC 26640]